MSTSDSEKLLFEPKRAALTTHLLRQSETSETRMALHRTADSVGESATGAFDRLNAHWQTMAHNADRAFVASSRELMSAVNEVTKGEMRLAELSAKLSEADY